MPDLVCMYHFVHAKTCSSLSKLPGLTSLEFEAQLDRIEQHYDVLSPQEFLDYKQSSGGGRARALLTFDDGLKEHFEVVFPVLKQRGLKGLFFPITQPLVHATVPFIEKQRYLQYVGYPTYSDFLEQFLTTLRTCEGRGLDGGRDPLQPSHPSQSYLSQYDFYSPHERYYRWIRDTQMTPLLFHQVIERLFKSCFKDTKRFIQTYYMSVEELLEMQEAGMAIGLHTHHHELLSLMEHSQVFTELELNLKFHKQLFKRHPQYLAYPNGLSHPAAHRFCKKQRIDLAFKVGNDFTTHQDSRFEIKRIDSASVMKKMGASLETGPLKAPPVQANRGAHDGPPPPGKDAGEKYIG